MAMYAGVPARRLRSRDKDRTLAAEDELYARLGRPEPSYRSVPPEVMGGSVTG